MPSAAKQRPRYNVPVAFMSRGVVDPYEFEQAVIEPPRGTAVPDQAAESFPIELPSSRNGLGAGPSSMEIHLEEDIPLAGVASSQVVILMFTACCEGPIERRRQHSCRSCLAAFCMSQSAEIASV